MDRAAWSRLDALFHAALAQPPDARQRFIDDACRDAPDLARQLRALLAAEARAEGLLGALAGQAADALDELRGGRGAVDDAAPREVGPYRILQRVAVGGMGAVYRAERVDGAFEQRVALKLIKRGMDSAQIVARFRTERQILARLEHPGIARLLDGGMTPDGQPWFAMEYVDGEPLGRYCDARTLSIDARLRLFLGVCDAVQYAHRNLVVHRDLKPDNILVTADGAVKLLDFGIAKVLDPAEDRAAITQTGSRPMTPDYAAPEQVLGEPVTTATDVYALGIVLYELLSGRHPFGAPARTPAESERRARTGEPERPSAAVARPAAPSGATSRAEADPVRLAAARHSQPERLRRRLAGDLDNICLMALRREPGRRYGSVEALAEDVARHLGGLPVHARPDTAAYRARKFVGRHRAGVASAALVVALFTAGGALHTAQLRRERDTADQERAAAEQVTAFLTDIFRSADPTHALGDTITARQLLAGARQRLDSALVSQPRVRGRLLGILGGVYQELGRYAEADTLLEQGLALTQRTEGAESPRVAGLLEERELTRVGLEDWGGAIDAGRRAVAIREAAGDTAALAESLRRLAGVYVNHRDFAAAEPLVRRALGLEAAAHGRGSLEVAATLHTLGGLLYFQARFDSAVAVDRRALAIRRARLDPRDPRIAATLHNLGIVQDRLAHFDSARAEYEEALSIARAAEGPDHPDVVALERDLADVLSKMGQNDSALVLHHRVLDSVTRTAGPVSQSVATALLSIGADYGRTGQIAQSVPWFRRSLEVTEKVFPGGSENLYYPLNNLAVALNMLGRYAQALPLERRALAIKQKAVGPSHPDVALLLDGIATSLAGLRRDAEAESYFLRSIRVYEETIGDEGGNLSFPLEDLADLDVRRGRYAEAARLYGRALPMVETARYGNDPADLAAYLAKYARAASRAGQAAQARRLEARARKLHEQRGGAATGS